MAGYWPNLAQSRAEARRLLREAGVPDDFTFKLLIRDVDQPHKIVGLWLITQWRSIGLNAEPWVQPTEPISKRCGAVLQSMRWASTSTARRW